MNFIAHHCSWSLPPSRQVSDIDIAGWMGKEFVESWRRQSHREIGAARAAEEVATLVTPFMRAFLRGLRTLYDDIVAEARITS